MTLEKRSEHKQDNKGTESDSDTLLGQKRQRKSTKRRREGAEEKRKRIKPDWECLPGVVLVTLNYKWSLTFRAKAHNHNIIPMMHFQWQATPLPSGLALTTDLCPCFPSSLWTEGFRSLSILFLCLLVVVCPTYRHPLSQGSATILHQPFVVYHI